MSATRTQVYLTVEQRQRLDVLTKATGLTLAQVIRRALDEYLATQHADVDAALADTYGADPEAMTPSRDDRSPNEPAGFVGSPTFAFRTR